MRAHLHWSAVVFGSALILDLAILVGVPTPARLPLTLWFLLVCPGMSFAPLLAIRQPRQEVLVAVAASIVLDTLVATALAEIGALSTISSAIVLELICALGVALQVGRPSMPSWQLPAFRAPSWRPPSWRLSSWRPPPSWRRS